MACQNLVDIPASLRRKECPLTVEERDDSRAPENQALVFVESIRETPLSVVQGFPKLGGENPMEAIEHPLREPRMIKLITKLLVQVFQTRDRPLSDHLHCPTKVERVPERDVEQTLGAAECTQSPNVHVLRGQICRTNDTHVLRNIIKLASVMMPVSDLEEHVRPSMR